MTDGEKDDLLAMGGQALEIGRRIMLSAARGRLSDTARREFAFEMSHLARRIEADRRIQGTLNPSEGREPVNAPKDKPAA